MSQYVIDVDIKSVETQICVILNNILNDELRGRYSATGREVSEAVKDLIYSRKNEIIEMVVDKAVKEIVRKGLPKLLERMGDDER